MTAPDPPPGALTHPEPAPATVFPVPWATVIDTAAGPVLHHDLTGRTLPLSPPLARGWAALQAGEPIGARIHNTLNQRGFLSREAHPAPEPVLQERWPIHGRWSVFYQASGQPIRLVERAEAGAAPPAEAGPDTPWQVRHLDAAEAFVWLNARGTVTTAELFGGLTRLGLDLDRAGAALLRWTHARQQLVKLLDEGIDRRGHLPPHFYTLLHPPTTPGALRLTPRLLDPVPSLGWPGLARALAAGLATRGGLRATPRAATVGPAAATLTVALRRARPAAALAAEAPRWPVEGPTLAHWGLDLVLGELTEEAPLAVEQVALLAQRLPQALAAGGLAWLLAPRAQAEALAAALGPAAQVEPVAAWLPLPTTPVLAGPAPWFEALDVLLAALGCPPLPARPLTRADLARHLAPWPLEGLHHLSDAPARERIGPVAVAERAVLTFRA